MSFPTEFDSTRKQVRACEVCGEPTSSGSRCTNGRCPKCHVEHCTPGGATSPGHGRGTVATPFARMSALQTRQWFEGSSHKTGTTDERCSNCGAPFSAHYNGRCPADEGES